MGGGECVPMQLTEEAGVVEGGQWAEEGLTHQLYRLAAAVGFTDSKHPSALLSSLLGPQDTHSVVSTGSQSRKGYQCPLGTCQKYRLMSPIPDSLIQKFPGGKDPAVFFDKPFR